MKRHRKNKYFVNPSYVLRLAYHLNLSLLLISNIDRDSVFEQIDNFIELRCENTGLDTYAKSILCT